MRENRSGSGGGYHPLIVVLLPVIFLILIIPSSSYNGFRPSIIRSRWDVVNLVLVLFAVLCGLFGRKSEEDQNNASPPSDYSPPVGIRRMRSSTSYPDLRQNWWGPHEEADTYRSFDDIQLYRSTPSRHHHDFSPLATNQQQEKQIIADTVQYVPEENQTVGMRRTRSISNPDLQREEWWGPHDADAYRFSDDIQLYRASPRKPDPPQEYKQEIPKTDPGPVPEERTVRMHRNSSSYPDLQQEDWWGPLNTDSNRFSDDTQLYRATPRKSNPRKSVPKPKLPAQQPVEELDVEPTSPPKSAPPPPPPPPPPPMSPIRVEMKRINRKKSGGAKDIAAALTHFYQKKKKKNKNKVSHTDEPVPTTSSIPPPPPLPPPPSVFQQLFKKNVSKRHHHSVPPTPPPPPPPRNSLPKKKHKPRNSNNKYPLPPSPLRPSQNLHREREYVISPSAPYYSIPMPPPPPPPPSYDSDKEQSKEQTQFCPPSPDVNNKAEMFIARFRAGLKLEKLNSIKLKEEIQKQQEQEQQVD